MAEIEHTLDTPRCGVVILNYNTHDLTVSLAHKIATYSSINEICVVDNGSNDDFAGDFNNSKIHYIKNEKNVGYSAGNNVGLRYLVKERNCDFVFIANPDVSFENSTIVEMCKNLIERPDLVLVSTKRYGYKGKLIHQYFDFPLFQTSIRNCFFLTRRNFEKDKHQIQNYEIDHADGIQFVDAVPGAFFGIRSSFLLEIDFLYEGIFLYGEEIILGRQAYDRGYKSGVINTDRYYHNHIQKRFSNRKMFWYDRSSLKIYYKKFGLLKWYKKFALSIAVLLGTFEYNCIYYLYRIIKGKDVK